MAGPSFSGGSAQFDDFPDAPAVGSDEMFGDGLFDSVFLDDLNGERFGPSFSSVKGKV